MLTVYNDILEDISTWETQVRKATRCRFLYWYKELYPAFFEIIVTDRHRLNRMNYLLMAIRDPVEMLHNIRHLNSAHVAVNNYKHDIYNTFTKYVVRPICQATEEELRLQIHCVLIPNMAQLNPVNKPPIDIQRYSSMNDLYLFEKQINMGYEIRKYLGHIFYEMSALTPHDYRTYEHIRSLTKTKLGFTVMRSHLPSAQLD
jgi:hypothetical protein